jgi:hypothetical protein
MSDLLTETEAATILRLKIKTLQEWRRRKVGPRYYKIGGRVKYALEDLRAYLAQCAVEPQKPAA